MVKMPIGSSAKILAKLIKMYRAAYVTVAQASTGGTNISDIIMKAILGGRGLQSKTNLLAGVAGKKPEEIIKILAKGFQK